MLVKFTQQCDHSAAEKYRIKIMVFLRQNTLDIFSNSLIYILSFIFLDNLHLEYLAKFN